MKSSFSSLFSYADLPGVPNALRLVFPYASRPWRKRDLENLDQHSEAVPYLNPKGYVDFYADDPEDPRNWSRAKSWYITAASIFVVLNGMMGTSMAAGCIKSITEEFQISEVAANLGTTLFQLGFCAGPFVFAPFSEFYGRRWLLYGAYACFMTFNFLVAFAPNFGAFAFGRLMAGTFVSAPLTVTPGILADIWPPLLRDNAMALLAVAIWSGPSMSPVISGFLDQEKNWRWAFYFLLWLGALGALAAITIPETDPSTILAQKAKRHREAKISGFEDVKAETEVSGRSLRQTYKTALLRPWALLFDPISFLCCLYMAVVFALQFMLFSIYPIVFEEIRGWTPAMAQLPLLGAVVGPFLGALMVFTDTYRRKKVMNKCKNMEPEQQLVLAMVGGVGFSVTMFWFTWTAPYPSIHWICPTLAGLALSFSLMLIFVAFVNYLVETYVQYAASIVAVNTICRSLGAATAPLYTNLMFGAMGVQGGGSFIAGLATALAVIPFVFFRYGRMIRDKSKYTSFSEGGQDQSDES